MSSIVSSKFWTSIVLGGKKLHGLGNDEGYKSAVENPVVAAIHAYIYGGRPRALVYLDDACWGHKFRLARRILRTRATSFSGLAGLWNSEPS